MLRESFVIFCSGALPGGSGLTNSNSTDFFPALRAFNASHNAFSGARAVLLVIHDSFYCAHQLNHSMGLLLLMRSGTTHFAA